MFMTSSGNFSNFLYVWSIVSSAQTILKEAEDDGEEKRKKAFSARFKS